MELSYLPQKRIQNDGLEETQWTTGKLRKIIQWNQEKHTWTKWGIYQRDGNHKNRDSKQEFNELNEKCGREKLQWSRANGRKNKWTKEKEF